MAWVPCEGVTLSGCRDEPVWLGSHVRVSLSVGVGMSQYGLDPMQGQGQDRISISCRVRGQHSLITGGNIIGPPIALRAGPKQSCDGHVMVM